MTLGTGCKLNKCLFSFGFHFISFGSVMVLKCGVEKDMLSIDLPDPAVLLGVSNIQLP